MSILFIAYGRVRVESVWTYFWHQHDHRIRKDSYVLSLCGKRTFLRKISRVSKFHKK